MAEPWLAAAPAAQLHDRGTRRALRVRRAGSRRPRALPDGAGSRHDARNSGGAPMTPRFFPCRTGKPREKTNWSRSVVDKTPSTQLFTVQSDVRWTPWQGSFDNILMAKNRETAP